MMEQSGRAPAYPKTGHDVAGFLFSNRTIHPLLPGCNAEGESDAPSVESLPLIVREPQRVRFADRHFSIEKEGLYRFWNWGKARWKNGEDVPQCVDRKRSNSNLILFKNDILALLEALSLVHVHGTRHQHLNFQEHLSRAKSGPLSLTCGFISQFAEALLLSLGWTARIVSGLSIDGAYNFHDNGHTMIEFFWPQHQKWILADLTLHQLFTRNGTFLNLAEVSNLIEKKTPFELKPLTRPALGTIDTAEDAGDSFDANGIVEPLFSDCELLNRWYRRNLAVPFILTEDAAYFYCGDPKQRDRACRYFRTHLPLEQKEWLNRFYGKPA